MGREGSPNIGELPGCGSGMAVKLAAALGARVSGLDAAAPLIEIARQRTPSGAFHVGEIEALPFDDQQFDVVTGFNSFQCAASPVSALREAKRVTKKNGCIAVAVWGAKENRESARYLAALGSCLPPPPPVAPGPFALSTPKALESLLGDAGWNPVRRGAATCFFEYADEETALAAMLSAGPAVRAMQNAGEDRVRSARLHSAVPAARRRVPDGKRVRVRDRRAGPLTCDR